ncbi:hypothetical protein [Streptomyces sp. NPDC095602]|uniref:hypothetical protein n=1 Tax=Streptomyces sp. NPDC095602 TaxID=3155819 RepID=UPI00332570D5
MTVLAVLAYGTVTLAAALGLVVVAPPAARGAYLLPAVRLAVGLTVALAYVAALWRP